MPAASQRSGFSGATRSKTGVAINAEDAATFKLPLGDTDPPPVARVLRAHANAQANILPFALLGLVYVMIGGAPEFAAWVFGIFCVARIAHSVGRRCAISGSWVETINAAPRSSAAAMSTSMTNAAVA